MRDGHLLRRAGREFAKNLIWMVVAFGALAAILVATTDLPLVGAMAFVGAASAVMSAIVTGVVIGSNAHDETPIGGQQHHYLWSPGPGDDWRDGGGWDGGGGADGGGGGGYSSLSPTSYLYSAECVEYDSLLKNPSTPLPSTLQGLDNPTIGVFWP